MFAFELVGGDGVENLMVELGAVAGLVGIRDILSEIIDGDAHAGAIDRLRGANRVGDLRARNEASGDPAA